jgi:hypothetical protein
MNVLRTKILTVILVSDMRGVTNVPYTPDAERKILEALVNSQENSKWFPCGNEIWIHLCRSEGVSK